MSEIDSEALLAEYTQAGSQAAFTAIVRHYINLVYSTALRKVGGDAHLARDVAQLVFTDLARKARALPAGVVLGGWLHHHTCFRAATVVRSERRRQARERIAAEMNTTENTPSDTWNRLAPLLDDGLDRLPARDRDAVVLRYFEGKSLGEVGRALEVSDDTAQKIVSRALDKLRDYFHRQGVATAGATVGAALTANSVQAAPVGLAAATAHASFGAAATGPVGKIMSFVLSRNVVLSATVAVAVVGWLAFRSAEPSVQDTAIPLRRIRVKDERLASEKLPQIARPEGPALAASQSARPVDDAGIRVDAGQAPAASRTDTLSVDFPNEDIRSLLKNVGDLFHLTIEMPADLKGAVTVQAKDATWREIFEMALKPFGYSFREDGRTVSVFKN